MPNTGPQSNPPSHATDAIATTLGWAHRKTGEHLVSVRDLAGAVTGYKPNSKKSVEDIKASILVSGITVNNAAPAANTSITYTVTLTAAQTSAIQVLTSFTGTLETVNFTVGAINNGVTLSNGYFNVPASVASFTVQVAVGAGATTGKTLILNAGYSMRIATVA